MFLLPLRGQHQRNAEAINSFVIILTAARSKVHHQVRTCRQDLLQRNRRPVPNLGGLALLHPHIQGAIRDILSLAHRRNAVHQSQAEQESDLRRRKRHHPLERHVQDSHLGMSRRKAHGGRAIPFGPLAQQELLDQRVTPHDRADLQQVLVTEVAHFQVPGIFQGCKFAAPVRLFTGLTVVSATRTQEHQNRPEEHQSAPRDRFCTKIQHYKSQKRS